jgi:hypothetical protein
MTLAPKTDNANLKSKLELRRHMLRRHHAAGDIRVFDCCQGSGVIWGRLRSEFPVVSYWGVDVKPKRGRLKIDSRRVVCQPNLRCNVIDIDTYGMPWDHWLGLLQNVCEPTTVFLTIGLVTMGGGSSLSKSVRSSVEIPADWPLSPVFTEELVRLSVSRFLSLPASGGYRVVEAWESTRGARARYIAVRIDRPAAEPERPRSKKPRQGT